MILLDSNFCLINNSLKEGVWKKAGELDEPKFITEMNRRFKWANGIGMLCFWAGSKDDYKCQPLKRGLTGFKKELNPLYFKNLSRMLELLATRYSKYERATITFKAFHKYRKFNCWFMLFGAGHMDPDARELVKKYLGKLKETFLPYFGRLNIYIEDILENPTGTPYIFDLLMKRFSLKYLKPGVQKVVKANDTEFKNTQKYRDFRNYYEKKGLIKKIQQSCRFTIHQAMKNGVEKLLLIEKNIPHRGKYFGWEISIDGDVSRIKRGNKTIRLRPKEAKYKAFFCTLFENAKAMKEMLSNMIIECLTYEDDNNDPDYVNTNSLACKWVGEKYQQVFNKPIHKNFGKSFEDIKEPVIDPIVDPEPDIEPEITLQCNTCEYVGAKNKCGHADYKEHDEQSCPYYQLKETKMDEKKTFFKKIKELWVKYPKSRSYVLGVLTLLVVLLLIKIF